MELETDQKNQYQRIHDVIERTPFESAVAFGNLDTIRSLYKAVRPSKAFLTRVLTFVIRLGAKSQKDNTVVIQFLLDKGANPLRVLKKTDFSKQRQDINNLTNNSEKQKILINIINKKERLLKKYYALKKLNNIFIAADVKTEKNGTTENRDNPYQKAAYLFEALAEKGFGYFSDKKTFAKTLAEELRKQAMAPDLSQNAITSCYDSIVEKIKTYKKNGGSVKDFGRLDTLAYYFQNKADKLKNKIEPSPLKQTSFSDDLFFQVKKPVIINNIETYLKEKKFNDPLTQFRMYFFGNDNSQSHAIVYKKLLENAESSKEFYFILSALFQSNRETLKRYISENRHFALSALKPKEIKFLKTHLGSKFPKIKNIDPDCPEKMSFNQGDILAMQEALSQTLKTLEEKGKDCGYVCAVTLNNLKYFIGIFTAWVEEHPDLQKSSLTSIDSDKNMAKQLADAIEQGHCSKSYVIKNILREIRQPASNTLTI